MDYWDQTPTPGAGPWHILHDTHYFGWSHDGYGYEDTGWIVGTNGVALGGPLTAAGVDAGGATLYWKYEREKSEFVEVTIQWRELADGSTVYIEIYRWGTAERRNYLGLMAFPKGTVDTSRRYTAKEAESIDRQDQWPRRSKNVAEENAENVSKLSDKVGKSSIIKTYTGEYRRMGRGK